MHSPRSITRLPGMRMMEPEYSPSRRFQRTLAVQAPSMQRILTATTILMCSRHRATTTRLPGYENGASGEFLPHEITSLAKGARDVVAADVDSDGDLDMLSASSTDGKIVWYENDGLEYFTPHLITESATNVQCICVADMDGDGDLDLLCSAAADSKITWYENNGHRVFEYRGNVATDVSSGSVAVADINGDGDQDVVAYVSASGGGYSVLWYENHASEGFSEHVVGAAGTGLGSVFLADVDSDGDMDVLSTSSLDNTVAWYENDGNGEFVIHTVTPPRPKGPSLCVRWT